MRVVTWIAVLGGAFLVAAQSPGAEPVPTAEKPWAFRTPVRPPIPAVRDAAWVRNPIDRFVLAKLEEAGLKPAAEADRPTLIRRLSFDLIGLPPTPEEVETFVNDRRPDAYERLVERLLASPRHGERWALFWLDLVRFAESNGFKSDEPRPDAWRYRDYVIRSFNDDKPYDRFLREQLAGDELYPDDANALIATGFHRHYPDESNAVDLEKRRQDILNDLTDTTGQVVLGLTLGCARCHDHKFDPILQTDYYRIQAFFAAFRPAEVPVGSAAEVEHYRQQSREWEAKTADVRHRMTELEGPYREQFLVRRKARFPKEYQAMYELPADQRTPLQQQIAAMVAQQVEIGGGDDVAKSMKPEVRQEWKELGKQMAEFNRARPRLGTALALTDIGPTAPATYLLKRGDWRQHGPEVVPGYLSAIEDRVAPIPPPSERKPEAQARETLQQPTTGRRAVLARWLTQPDNPLTARVMVNRLWQHHFGKGLVGTPSDFGAQGEPPSHPELLDWLATTFVAQGWSLKTLHRLLVTSSAYRQSSRIADCKLQIANLQSAICNLQFPDPENRLLWRRERQRLEGETLRDAMLAVSGLLSLKESGPSVYPELPAELGGAKKNTAWPVSADPEARHRRSVYVFVKRNQRYPLFSVFDAPDSNETCARRHLSTSAPQALALLNDATSLDQARAFAGRVLREAGPTPENVLARAFRVALGRLPDESERQALRTFLDRELPQLRERLAGKSPPPAPVAAPAGVDPAFAAAVVDVCHALLNVNEFLYVD